MRLKAAVAFAGAALFAGALAAPAQAAAPSPSWIKFTMPDRSAPKEDQPIRITAGQGDTESCKGCTVVIEFRAEGKKAWKKVKSKTFRTNGYAAAKVVAKKDGAYRIRSLDGKVKSKVHKVDVGHRSRVKLNWPKPQKEGALYTLTAKTTVNIDGKWRKVKGRQACVYGGNEKKVVCAKTKKDGTVSLKLVATSRPQNVRLTGTDAYLPATTMWFRLVRSS